MINKEVQYAALLLQELQKNPGVKIAEFCERKNLPKSFIERIGGKLRIAGLIESRKGPGGGYSLKAEKIALLHLVSIFMPGKMTTSNPISKTIYKALSPINVIE